MKSIKIGEVEINNSSKFFIIEEGQANGGDFSKALKMIDLAKEAKADAIEFQFAIPEDFYVDSSREKLNYYKNTQFSINKMIEIVKYAKNQEIEIIITALSHNLIKPMVKAGCSAFNINASDINNPDILDNVSKSGLPFFLNLALADIEEIEWAINRLNSQNNSNYILMHSQHTMASGKNGVSIEHTSFGFINTLKNKYNKIVGFTDHTPYEFTPSMAISAGADVISKHLCVSRDEKGPDWHICLEPEEMKNCISLFKKTEKSINEKNKVLAPGENLDKKKMRRSIVFSKNVEVGTKILKEHLSFKRPGDGIPPAEYSNIIGKVLNKSFKKDDQVSLKDLK
jgi:sialic acid synthase SpsE